jgi:hypothetical protein
MNQKLCKALRKVARQTALKSAERTGHEIQPVGYNENTKNRKKMLVQDRDDKGLVILNEDETPKMRAVDISLGTMQVEPSTVRGLYRKMKKTIAA